jgi:hypothetical protein
MAKKDLARTNAERKSALKVKDTNNCIPLATPRTEADDIAT